jgi:hypothetical protein
MIKISNYFSKKMLIIAAIPLLIMIYFFDNIKGQYRFMQYCKSEGGLRVYEYLEKGAGWLAKDEAYARAAALIDGVGFVRFFDKKENGYFDIRYTGGNPQREESFDKKPSDTSKKTRYLWRIDVGQLSGELRLSRTNYEVFDVSGNDLMVGYYGFAYSQFDQNKSFLGAPSGVSCFHYPARSINEISGWRKEINTAFKN